MDVIIKGLDSLLRDLNLDARRIKKAKDAIAQEVATGILAKAVDKANGVGDPGAYPVPVRTGTFKRAHKMEPVSEGEYKVFGDTKVANYFNYVHDGTWKMDARPTIDDAADEYVKSGEIDKAIDDILDEIIKGGD